MLLEARWREGNEILSEAGETSFGTSYEARQISSQLKVRLTVLSGDFTGNSSAYTRIEEAVERAKPIQDPNLIRILSLERLEPMSLLIAEWTHGFTLLELLRARRELTQSETLILLKQAAAGVDQATLSGLGTLDISLAQMHLHFPGGEERQLLFQTPVYEWPPILLKLNPLSVAEETSLGATWQGGQTMSGETGSQAISGERGTTPTGVQSLASIVHELLGGASTTRLPGAPVQQRYTPLATLSEEGNEILKRAMEQPAAFASAREFSEAFDRLEKGRRQEVRIASQKGAGTTAGTHSTSGRSAIPAPVSQPRGGGKSFPWLAIAMVAVVAGIAFLVIRPASHPPEVTAAAAAPELSPPTALSATPLHTEIPKLTASTPAPTAMPEPTTQVAMRSPLPSPTAPPRPTRQQLLAKAISAAEQFEAAENWPACLSAYAQAARDFPESDTGRVRLALVLDRFRSHPETIHAVDFGTLRRPLIDAAQLDIVSAMMLLGSRLRKDDPPTAFTWYRAAAEKGQVQAMTQVGLMVLERIGR